MFSLTIKGLWAHKLRYALTGLAVVLGVAFMAGTMVLTDTMQTTFDGVFESANEFSDTRDRIDASVVEQVAAVDGVAAARGSIQGITQLVHADGDATPSDGLE